MGYVYTMSIYIKCFMPFLVGMLPRMIILHPRKLTCPLKRDYFNRKYIFQPLIFRGHVNFPGSNCPESWLSIPGRFGPPKIEVVSSKTPRQFMWRMGNF